MRSRATGGEFIDERADFEEAAVDGGAGGRCGVCARRLPAPACGGGDDDAGRDSGLGFEGAEDLDAARVDGGGHEPALAFDDDEPAGFEASGVVDALDDDVVEAEWFVAGRAGEGDGAAASNPRWQW